MKNVILISLLLIITNAITYWLSDKIKLIFLKNEVPIIGIDNVPGCGNIENSDFGEVRNSSFAIAGTVFYRIVGFIFIVLAKLYLPHMR